MCLLVLIIGGSFAWLGLRINSSKTNILKAGYLSLVLDESETEGINIDKAIPTSDSKGLTQEGYTFKLVNNGKTAVNYTIYLDDLDFVRGYANVLIYEGKYDEAFSYINDKLKIFKDDDFLLKYKADVLMVKNRKGAVNLYNEVLNKTNNGILILEIKDILEGVNYE